MTLLPQIKRIETSERVSWLKEKIHTLPMAIHSIVGIVVAGLLFTWHSSREEQLDGDAKRSAVRAFLAVQRTTPTIATENRPDNLLFSPVHSNKLK